jgi:Mrp family chromosome partitioning ATPase
MGLIERAFGGQLRQERERPPRIEAGASFDLDLALLQSKGVYTPASRDAPLAYELRAIKRRLLRRIGFLQRAGRDPRELQAGGRPRNVILCTSTRPGEGKSFAAVNLAASLAFEEGLPVLLIDGDPTRPRLRSYFGLPAEKGLTDLLQSPGISLATACRRVEGLPLTVLGEGSKTANPTELFGSVAARRLFAAASEQWGAGVVIIDAPPMLATTETIALARHADEVVFVVEADATPQPAVAAALDELLELNPNVSLLLNRCLVPAGGSHYAAYEYYEKGPAETENQTARAE